MFSTASYAIKRFLRICDSHCARKTREVRFRGRSFQFYSTYWWSDVSQTLLDREIAPYFDALGRGDEPSVIIDVGAATGHFAVLAAKLFPNSTVYAFEPSTRQRILLARNACLNGVRNLQIESLGLWNRADQLPFRTNGDESSLESVSRFLGKLPFLEKVAVLPLDQWSREKDISCIDVIKMDAEGAEIEILEGAHSVLKHDHPRLLIQAYHIRDGVRSFERCVELLKQHEYLIREHGSKSGFLVAT